MILALILSTGMMVVFWVKWQRAEERADQASKAHEVYVAEADQRFLATREGRRNAQA